MVDIREWPQSLGPPYVSMQRNARTKVKSKDIGLHINLPENNWLDLSNNSISYVERRVFYSSIASSVNLTFNTLYNFHQEVVAVSPNTVDLLIYMKGNNLHCDCHNFLLQTSNQDV